MRIETRTRIGGALAICVLLAYGAVVLYLDRTTTDLSQESVKADIIVHKIASLRTFTQDYLLYRTERAQRQWSGTYAEVLLLLGQPEYRALQGAYSIEDARAKLQIVGDTFARVLALQQNPGAGNPAGELQNQLSAELLLAAQTLASRFRILNQNVNKKLLATQRLTSTLNILALLLLGGLLISNAVFLHRAVVKPVLKLQEGAGIIGSGNLDYKVGINTRDEVGELSRAFDGMTENIKNLTVSREELTQEVAERRKAEEALRESQERLRIAQQAAQWGVFDFNYATGENYWSPEIQMLYGIQPGTFEGTYEGWSKRLHPEDRERAERAHDLALETGEYAEDFRVVRPDGSERWLFARAKVLRDAEGRPLRMLGVNVDITARKQAEAEIERLASFPRLNPNPVLEVDFAGNITYANPATLEVLKELGLAEDVSIFLPGDMATILKEVKETGKNQIYREVEIGKSIFALFIFSPPDLNVVRFYSIDITGLKRAEAALSRLNEELEQRVEERTADLERANEALQQSEQRLRYLASQILTAQEKERKRMAMELHEGLGQSMTALKMYLRAIHRHLPPESSRIQKDFDSVQILLYEMIEEVRRMSRGLSPAVLETLGLTAALNHLLGELSSYQEVTINADIDDIQNLFSSQAEVNLFRIFQEALNNIAKHSQATQVSVNIKRQDGRVNFLIKDNGVGFNLKQAAQENIIDKGMGLAAIDERLRMIGTHLNIVSHPGMGTEINFSVPHDANNRKRNK